MSMSESIKRSQWDKSNSNFRRICAALEKHGPMDAEALSEAICRCNRSARRSAAYLVRDGYVSESMTRKSAVGHGLDAKVYARTDKPMPPIMSCDARALANRMRAEKYSEKFKRRHPAPDLQSIFSVWRSA